jgi:hypothetical protein
MLKGTSLQVPLYQLLAGDGACVELLGVGPAHDPARVPDEAARRPRFTGFDARTRPGFDETLATLLGVLRDGRFAMRPGRHCSWCDFRPACRRLHPPTLAREAADPEVADLRGLDGKSIRAALLAQVAARAADGSDEEA